MSKKKIEDTVNNVLNLSNSQKDRLAISNVVQHDLLDFLQTQIKKVNNGNELKEMVLEGLKEDLLNTEEPLGARDKMVLLDILSKNDNDLAGNIISVLKESQKAMVQLQINNHKDGSGKNLDEYNDTEFTKEEIQEAKDLLKEIKKIKTIKETEFVQNE